MTESNNNSEDNMYVRADITQEYTVNLPSTVPPGQWTALSNMIY